MCFFYSFYSASGVVSQTGRRGNKVILGGLIPPVSNFYHRGKLEWNKSRSRYAHSPTCYPLPTMKEQCEKSSFQEQLVVMIFMIVVLMFDYLK